MSLYAIGPEEIKINNEKAASWIANSAQPTDTVKVLLDVLEETTLTISTIDA